MAKMAFQKMTAGYFQALCGGRSEIWVKDSAINPAEIRVICDGRKRYNADSHKPVTCKELLEQGFSKVRVFNFSK